VAQLVHDLRNQLMVVLGCAENLVWLMPTGQARKEIADLFTCAERASLLARQLLLGARAESADRNVIDLNQVVARAAPLLSRALSERIILRLRLSEEAMPILADVMEIERVLLNLALNARDAMGSAGVLTIETEVVCDPEPHAWMTVTDTGCGLTPEVRGRMFEPFFTTKESGTGLGLSSVTMTVELLQGALAVESEIGRGTSISVILPLATEAPSQKATKP
jgi:signal transduction histidine kinase